VWLLDSQFIIVDLPASGSRLRRGKIRDEVIQTWFVNKSGVWYFILERVCGAELQKVNRRDLISVSNYFGGLDRAKIVYRETLGERSQALKFPFLHFS
jgi:hypothetical protein